MTDTLTDMMDTRARDPLTPDRQVLPPQEWGTVTMVGGHSRARRLG
jgi:hypothetical protein